jgi:galactose mutarotase-like enzyme
LYEEQIGMPEDAAGSNGRHIELWSAGLSAAIAPHGAQLMSLKTAGGNELLWQGDPDLWPDRAPILFPVIGPLTGGHIRYAGMTYAMPAHGFARSSEFVVRGSMRNRAVFELHANAETRRHYPFDFTLRVVFDLSEARLNTTITVTNEGAQPMPTDVGFHPGFNRPLDDGDDGAHYGIVFAEHEPAPIRRGVDDPIFLTGEEHPTPVEGGVLRLRADLFEDNAMVFDRVASRSLVYGSLKTESGPRLLIEYPDSPFLAIWSRPGAPFTAIEPWQGLPSPIGFDGDLMEKPGIAVLQPGENRSWRLDVSILDPERRPDALSTSG